MWLKVIIVVFEGKYILSMFIIRYRFFYVSISLGLFEFYYYILVYIVKFRNLVVKFLVNCFFFL